MKPSEIIEDIANSIGIKGTNICPDCANIKIYLNQEAERREKWEQEIGDKVKGLCEVEKMRATRSFGELTI